MKKKSFQWIPAVVLVAMAVAVQSCGRDKICECIEVGDALNRKSSAVLSKGNPSKADEKILVDLRKKKQAACKQFETMSGPEMMERKASCD